MGPMVRVEETGFHPRLSRLCELVVLVGLLEWSAMGRDWGVMYGQ